MAIGSMFISPRYNVGERCAGGSITIYADNSLQALVPLWCYADLQINPDDGTGSIANPLPVDNNGINASAVFYNSEAYPSAYYVLRDAMNAVVRSGFIIPQSWQITGNSPADPTNPWDNFFQGDLFWGYEVVNSVASRGNIGRPLFFMPGSGADRSGGMVVWFQPGAAGPDNILTFQGDGGLWKAREEWINYSYLENSLNSMLGIGNSEPFTFLQQNYQNQYNVILDKIPQAPTQNWNTVFTGKIRIDKPLTGVGNPTSGLFAIRVDIPDGSMLELQQSIPLNYTNGFHVIEFYVRGLSCKYSQITHRSNVDGSVSNFVKGQFSSVFFDITSETFLVGLNDSDVAEANGLPGAINDNMAGVNTVIRSCMSTPFAAQLKASTIQSLGIEKIRLAHGDNHIISMDASLYAKTELGNKADRISGKLTTFLKLTDPTNIAPVNYNWEYMTKKKAFYVEPAAFAYNIDSTFAAVNAEAYNSLNAVDETVRFLTINQDGPSAVGGPTPPSSGNGSQAGRIVYQNNLIILDHRCKGELIIDIVNSEKIYLKSKDVFARAYYNLLTNIEACEGTIFVEKCGGLKAIQLGNIIANIEPSLKPENIRNNGIGITAMNRQFMRADVGECINANVIFRKKSFPASVSDMSYESYFLSGDLKDSQVEFWNSLIQLHQFKAERCALQGYIDSSMFQNSVISAPEIICSNDANLQDCTLSRMILSIMPLFDLYKTLSGGEWVDDYAYASPNRPSTDALLALYNPVVKNVTIQKCRNAKYGNAAIIPTGYFSKGVAWYNFDPESIDLSFLDKFKTVYSNVRIWDNTEDSSEGYRFSFYATLKRQAVDMFAYIDKEAGSIDIRSNSMSQLAPENYGLPTGANGMIYGDLVATESFPPKGYRFADAAYAMPAGKYGEIFAQKVCLRVFGEPAKYARNMYGIWGDSTQGAEVISIGNRQQVPLFLPNGSPNTEGVNWWKIWFAKNRNSMPSWVQNNNITQIRLATVMYSSPLFKVKVGGVFPHNGLQTYVEPDNAYNNQMYVYDMFTSLLFGALNHTSLYVAECNSPSQYKDYVFVCFWNEATSYYECYVMNKPYFATDGSSSVIIAGVRMDCSDNAYVLDAEYSRTNI